MAKLMSFSDHKFPDLETLTNNINSALRENKSIHEQVTILNRESNSFASTFPSEIITCQLSDGRQLKILCKYAVGRINNTYCHQNGLFYEADVYRYLLQSLPISSPALLGVYLNQVHDELWLILEYFDNSSLVKDYPELDAMQAAANWLARFHRLGELFLSRNAPTFLNSYNVEYYRGWAERTSHFGGNLHRQFPWLASLCSRYDQVINTFFESPSVIIHGEYYTNNIIFSEGMIFPIDWESAAIAIGEIDLASLIENWPPDFETKAINEYLRMRWPEDPPPNFYYRLDAAKLYWHFRWLGDRFEWTANKKDRWRFEEIHRLGERLGLV
jgi:hypothetical protein